MAAELIELLCLNARKVSQKPVIHLFKSQIDQNHRIILTNGSKRIFVLSANILTHIIQLENDVLSCCFTSPSNINVLTTSGAIFSVSLSEAGVDQNLTLVVLAADDRAAKVPDAVAVFAFRKKTFVLSKTSALYHLQSFSKKSKDADREQLQSGKQEFISNTETLDCPKAAFSNSRSVQVHILLPLSCKTSNFDESLENIYVVTDELYNCLFGRELNVANSAIVLIVEFGGIVRWIPLDIFEGNQLGQKFSVGKILCDLETEVVGLFVVSSKIEKTRDCNFEPIVPRSALVVVGVDGLILVIGSDRCDGRLTVTYTRHLVPGPVCCCDLSGFEFFASTGREILHIDFRCLVVNDKESEATFQLKTRSYSIYNVSALAVDKDTLPMKSGRNLYVAISGERLARLRLATDSASKSRMTVEDPGKTMNSQLTAIGQLSEEYLALKKSSEQLDETIGQVSLASAMQSAIHQLQQATGRAWRLDAGIIPGRDDPLPVHCSTEVNIVDSKMLITVSLQNRSSFGFTFSRGWTFHASIFRHPSVSSAELDERSKLLPTCACDIEGLSPGQSRSIVVEIPSQPFLVSPFFVLEPNVPAAFGFSVDPLVVTLPLQVFDELRLLRPASVFRPVDRPQLTASSLLKAFIRNRQLTNSSLDADCDSKGRTQDYRADIFVTNRMIQEIPLEGDAAQKLMRFLLSDNPHVGELFCENQMVRAMSICGHLVGIGVVQKEDAGDDGRYISINSSSLLSCARLHHDITSRLKVLRSSDDVIPIAQVKKQKALMKQVELCPGGLSNFVRNEVSSENVLQVVHQSVEEISLGLAADITPEETDHWNLMLAALSTWKSISCIAELDVTCPTPSNVVHLLRPLPSWNAAFYYGMLKRNKWGNYCIRVLDVLEMSTGISLLKTILDQFNDINDRQNDDLRIASAVVEYLCLVENKYLPYLIWNACSESAEDSTQGNGRSSGERGSNTLLPNDQRKMLREFMRFKQTVEENQQRNLAKSDESKRLCQIILFKSIRQMLTVKEIEKLSDGDRARLLISMLSFISLALGACGSALQNQCLFGNSSGGPKASETSAKSTISSSCEKSNTSVHLIHEDLPLACLKPPHNFTLNPDFIDDLTEVVSLANDCAINFTASAKEFLCQAEPRDLRGIYGIDPVLFLGSCRHIFIESYSRLQEHLENILDARLKENLQTFLNGLHETHSIVNDFVQSLHAHSMQPTQMFERALVKIAEKSSTAEDHFIWILETDSKEVIKNPRWLKCVDECCSASGFLNENLVVRVLSSLSRLKHEFDNETLKKFQLAIVKAYGSLSLDRENVVLEEFYGKCSTTPFEVDVNQFRRHFAELFRELTSADKPEFRDKMKELSCLVLQSPFEAVSALVSSVIQNKRYGEVFVKLLRALPLMTHLESSEGHLVVFECLQGHLDSEKLSKTAKTYVLSLFRHLLTADAGQKRLCCTRKFLSVCVFSRGNLMSTALDDESEISSVIIALRLLLIAFESLDPAEVTWSLVESHAVLPLVVWLCRVVDRCRDLWPASFSGGRVLVKETVLKTLNCLLVTLDRCKDKIPDHHLCWLCRQLSQVHWTVIHYVKPLLTDLPSTAHSMLPDQLNEFLCGSNQNLTESNVYMLLDGCRVSEDFVQLVLNRVQPQSTITIPSNLYPKLVYCLSEILFDSIKSEWFRIATVLSRLLVNDFAAAKISDVNELCVCNLFVDAILIKKEMTLDENCKTSTWLHVVQCFSEYFKNCVLKDFRSKDEIAFAKCCLYVVTRLWCIVPKAGAMPLFNLVLEVCTFLSNSVKSTDDHVTKVLVRNAIAEVNQTVHL